MAGHPSKVERKLAERAVSVVRKAVNTKAFEYVVIGAINRNSTIHKMLTKSPPAVRL